MASSRNRLTGSESVKSVDPERRFLVCGNEDCVAIPAAARISEAIATG